MKSRGRKNLILPICISILVLIEITSIFLMWKSISAKETMLEDAKLKEIDKNNMFAIMLGDKDGVYTESSSNKWPTDMKYNESLSGCIDNSGNKIDDALSYDKTTNIVTVRTNATSYCYLYFDKIYTLSELCSNGDNLGNCLLTNNSEIDALNDNEEGGLYRYQGTSANNYICFGTSDEATCTGNTDAYMYRIMGINSSNQLKLIKNEALNSSDRWYSDYTTDITWPQSTVYSNINGSTFLTNSTYMPSGWSSKIATTTWKYGDNRTDNTTAASLYSTENGWTSTTSAKIGLMYMHDYYYGLAGGNNCSESGAYTTCKTSWLFLGNCDSGAPSSYEWTMSRWGYGSNIDNCFAWGVHSSGYVNGWGLNGPFAVRPVFYLTSDVAFVSGTGTSSDPFIIS